jgi:hypothetical protein
LPAPSISLLKENVMETENNDVTAPVEKLFKEYSISPQEGERIVEQFGTDKAELELLLGHKGAPETPSPNTDDVAESYVLFDI